MRKLIVGALCIMSACFSKPGFEGDDSRFDANPTNILPIDAVFEPKATVGDVNGDGYDDLVLRGQSANAGGKWSIWISYGGPSFNPSRSLCF
jgi:hypothetical protein